MSEYDDIERRRNDAPDEPPDTPEAAAHVAKLSPWVWLLPVVAVFFVGYMIVRYGFFGGGDITVRFSEARGLERYSPVRFRGAKVGTVQKITVDAKLSQVVVRISMDASMDDALTKGTRFWIVEPGLEGGGIGGLLSGTYVGIAPGAGDETREFVGQEYAPILAAPEEGKTFLLDAMDGIGSLAVGTPIHYQGMRVGRILGAAYDEQRRVTAVHAFVVRRFANDVRQSTRWWRGGGLNISLDGGGVSMGAGLTSLLTTPVHFYTPEVMAGASMAEGTRFQLYENEGAAIAASDGPHLTYLTYFQGPIGGLAPGTPVKMKGMQVGRVRDVRLRYVSQTASLETPVVLEIDPRELELPVSDTTSRAELRAAMNDALAKLINKGMRATLATSLVLPGASAVNLETVAKPGTGRLVVANDPPIIPAAAPGGGIDGAVSAITDVATTIRNLPLDEIAGNMRSASARLDALISDPALDRSLQRLDSSLAEIEKITKTTGQNVEPIIESLRNAADSAESAAKSAEQLMGSGQKQSYDVAELVRELTRAAEAVRGLANYLTENPDAVIKGETRMIEGQRAEGQGPRGRRQKNDGRWRFCHLPSALCALLLVAGCGVLKRVPNQFYTLDTFAAEGVRAAVAGAPIGLDTVELPPGIDRRELVLRGADHKLEVRGQQQWASPLEEMVLHTLAFDLANRLPEGMVVLPGQMRPAGARSLAVTFEDLAAGPDGELVLDARWTLAGVTHHERIRVPLASSESPAVVAAMSRALAMLADRIVAGM